MHRAIGAWIVQRTLAVGLLVASLLAGCLAPQTSDQPTIESEACPPIPDRDRLVAPRQIEQVGDDAWRLRGCLANGGDESVEVPCQAPVAAYNVTVWSWSDRAKVFARPGVDEYAANLSCGERTVPAGDHLESAAFDLTWDATVDVCADDGACNATREGQPVPHGAYTIRMSYPGFVEPVRRTVIVGDPATVRANLTCNTSPPLSTTTAGYIEQGCWAHLGQHRYVLGVDRAWQLEGGSGWVRSVEQQLAPPEDVEPGTDGVRSKAPVEVSIDGREWHRVGVVEYELVSASTSPVGTRQDIRFTLDGSEEPFRFFRIRQPRSSSEGLSGYLDASRIDLNLSPAGVAADPGLDEATRLTCTNDILEDVFAEHPCWYGGADRWDAPSFVHTYPIGPTNVSRIDGQVQMAYFRPDDPGFCCNQTPEGVENGTLLVQVSRDAVDWRTVHRVDVTYGEETTFASPELAGLEARFVRLIGTKHPGYSEDPALKHPEGYMLDSAFTLTPS